MKTHLAFLMMTLIASLTGFAQVNSGSDGHDGALNPASNLVIDMADHPDGIYHYTSVNIPAGVTVTFIPNANNKPVVWLVQNSCTIAGIVSVKGENPTLSGGRGGPGGFAGGAVGGPASLPGNGLGPGGAVASNTPWMSGNASFGTLGGVLTTSPNSYPPQDPPGSLYGSSFLVPLMGGSGGAGISTRTGGCGGGGAILIAASNSISLTGQIVATGGTGSYSTSAGAGGGSGGAVRLVATTVSGNGSFNISGGVCNQAYYIYYYGTAAGSGRARIDSLQNQFVGSVNGPLTVGYQPIIIPPANQAVGLAIQSLGGVAVAANPTGQLTTPDVIVPSNQQNPVQPVNRRWPGGNR